MDNKRRGKAGWTILERAESGGLEHSDKKTYFYGPTPLNRGGKIYIYQAVSEIWTNAHYKIYKELP